MPFLQLRNTVKKIVWVGEKGLSPFFFTQLAFPGHVISNTSGFVGGAAGEQQKMPTFLNAYFFPQKV